MNRTPHGHSAPYWTRAHRDWRVWVGVVLMLALMIVYLLSDDLAWRPHLQTQQAVPAAVVK
jgi:type II secretory pathway component PulM